MDLVGVLKPSATFYLVFLNKTVMSKFTASFFLTQMYYKIVVEKIAFNALSLQNIQWNLLKYYIFYLRNSASDCCAYLRINNSSLIFNPPR